MARRRRGRRRVKRQGKKGGLPLSTVTLVAFLFFVLIFAIALWLSLQVSFGQIRANQREAKEVISHSVASQLSKAVASYAYSLEILARDPDLIALVSEGDKKAIKQRSSQLYTTFPYAKSLRIYPIGTPRLDKSVQPEVGYACLNLISLIDRGNKQPPVEIHVPRTPQQHLEIVRPVYNGKRLIGYLQLTLDVKAVQIWIHSVIGDNYVELIQAAENQELGRKMGQAKKAMQDAQASGDDAAFREAYQAYRDASYDPEPIDYFYDVYKPIRERARTRSGVPGQQG